MNVLGFEMLILIFGIFSILMGVYSTIVTLLQTLHNISQNKKWEVNFWGVILLNLIGIILVIASQNI